MPKRKEPELDPKEQFKRFKETAKEGDVDAAAAEKAFAGVAKAKSLPPSVATGTKPR